MPVHHPRPVNPAAADAVDLPAGTIGPERRLAIKVPVPPSRPAAPVTARPQKALFLAGLLALGHCLIPSARAAEDPGAATLRAAKVESGRAMVTELKCSACHARKFGGDGSSIYRPHGRISTPAKLLAMVEMCNTELNLQLFPEDIADISAALNADHYKFKLTPP